MKKSVIKPIIFGILLGAFVFFTGPLILIILLLKFIFTPFGMGRMMNRGYGNGLNSEMQIAFAEKIRNMNDEEFISLKEKMKNRFNGRCYKQYC